MVSLRELQTWFAEALLYGDEARLVPYIVANGVPAQRRLAIYRNSASAGFIKSLQTTFPAIERLGGADWFHQIALAYWSAHPSSSGDLHYAGAQFAQFLRVTLLSTEYDYFGDVAQLEWMYHDVLIAADASPLDITALGDIPAPMHEHLIFAVHPAVKWMRSTYPVFAIWNANRLDAIVQDTAIELDGGPSCVVLIRRSEHVEVREVAASDFSLLECFAAQMTLADACEATMRSHPNFDLGPALIRFAQWQVLSSCSLRAG